MSSFGVGSLKSRMNRFEANKTPASKPAPEKTTKPTDQPNGEKKKEETAPAPAEPAGKKKFGFQAPKREKCSVCNIYVYEMEKLVADEKVYHKTCFKCKKCKKTVGVGNYASLDGSIFCKPHFKELFKLKGNYEEGFGKQRHKNKWLQKQGSTDSQPGSRIRRQSSSDSQPGSKHTSKQSTPEPHAHNTRKNSIPDSSRKNSIPESGRKSSISENKSAKHVKHKEEEKENKPGSKDAGKPGSATSKQEQSKPGTSNRFNKFDKKTPAAPAPKPKPVDVTPVKDEDDGTKDVEMAEGDSGVITTDPIQVGNMKARFEQEMKRAASGGAPMSEARKDLEAMRAGRGTMKSRYEDALSSGAEVGQGDRPAEDEEDGAKPRAKVGDVRKKFSAHHGHGDGWKKGHVDNIPPPSRQTHTRSAHNRPTHDKSAHDRPIHNKATHEKTGHDKAGHNRPIHNKATHEKTGHDKAGHDRPILNKETHEKTGHDKAGHDRPIHNKPAHEKAGHEKADHDRPIHNRPKSAHDKQVHDKSTHNKATHREQHHNTSAHNKPAHNRPTRRQFSKEQDHQEKSSGTPLKRFESKSLPKTSDFVAKQRQRFETRKKSNSTVHEVIEEPKPKHKAAKPEPKPDPEPVHIETESTDVLVDTEPSDNTATTQSEELLHITEDDHEDTEQVETKPDHGLEYANIEEDLHITEDDHDGSAQVGSESDDHPAPAQMDEALHIEEDHLEEQVGPEPVDSPEPRQIDVPLLILDNRHGDEQEEDERQGFTIEGCTTETSDDWDPLMQTPEKIFSPDEQDLSTAIFAELRGEKPDMGVDISHEFRENLASVDDSVLHDIVYEEESSKLDDDFTGHVQREKCSSFADTLSDDSPLNDGFCGGESLNTDESHSEIKTDELSLGNEESLTTGREHTTGDSDNEKSFQYDESLDDLVITKESCDDDEALHKDISTEEPVIHSNNIDDSVNNDESLDNIESSSDVKSPGIDDSTNDDSLLDESFDKDESLRNEEEDNELITAESRDEHRSPDDDGDGDDGDESLSPQPKTDTPLLIQPSSTNGEQQDDDDDDSETTSMQNLLSRFKAIESGEKKAGHVVMSDDEDEDGDESAGNTSIRDELKTMKKASKFKSFFETVSTTGKGGRYSEDEEEEEGMEVDNK